MHFFEASVELNSASSQKEVYEIVTKVYEWADSMQGFTIIDQMACSKFCQKAREFNAVVYSSNGSYYVEKELLLDELERMVY
jgi:hypothetical protein